MTPVRFAKIAMGSGLILLPLLSPALTVVGLIKGLPAATVAALAVAATLALSGATAKDPPRSQSPAAKP